MWNYALEKLASGDLIMLCADDIRFKSPSWDTYVREAFETHGSFSLVYGDDLVHGRRLSTHPFVHREWIRVSGFWLPPYFVSDFVDLWLDEVSKALGADVYISQMSLPNTFTLVWGKVRLTKQHKIVSPVIS